MAKNYFIGIGGTGARVAESLVHLCAAGLGPKQLTVFLIDPDSGNGNLSRTIALLKQYADAAKEYKDRMDGIDLFGTHLTLPNPEVWSVINDGSTSLERHIDLNTLDRTAPALGQLARVLFSDEERQTKLNEGFRGHPNIGAAILSNVPSDADPWKTFWQDVSAAESKPGQVQVFLAGSIFGGTGAAGMPTLASANVLKHSRQASLGGGKSKIRLGALLMLPYFSFQPGTPPAGDPQMFVTPDDFPAATQAALAYYRDKQLSFDDVYLFGDAGNQSVGAFSPGADKQSNAPHAVEVGGAFAALDFFDTPAPVATRYLHAWRTDSTIDWDALPVTSRGAERIERHNRVRHAMATFNIFAHAYLGYALPALDRSPADMADVWHRNHFYPKKLWGHDETKDPRKQRQALDTLAAYLRSYVKWAASLDALEAGTALFDRSKIVADDGGGVLDPAQHTAALGGALRGFAQRSYPAGSSAFSAFKDVLDSTDVRNKPTDGVSNTDRFVNLFWTVSQAFAVEHHNLQGASPPAAAPQ